MGKRMGKIPNLPARRADSFESAGKSVWERTALAAGVLIFSMEVQPAHITRV